MHDDWGECSGGVDILWLNKLVQTLGHLVNKSIDWDTETLGCFSSRSMLVADAFSEVQQWLLAPGNEREVVILMFDDQEDLLTWGKVPALMELIREVPPLVGQRLLCCYCYCFCCCCCCCYCCCDGCSFLVSVKRWLRRSEFPIAFLLSALLIFVCLCPCVRGW